MAHSHVYNAVSVRRVPASSTAPSYNEVGLLQAGAISVTDTLTGEPSEANLSVSTLSLDSDTKGALRDLAGQPLEIWIYRDGVRIFAGPVVGGEIGRDTTSLVCRDRLVYLAYMLVFSDKTFVGVDMFTTAAEFINDWQALTYGNFGIDTSSVGTLGITRSLTVLGASEQPRVLDVIKSYAEGNFDFWMDPSSNQIVFAASRGTDLSTSVIIERGIANATAGFALGPGVLASEVYATGSSGADIPLSSTVSDTGLRASFGRAGHGVSFDPVTDAAHLTDLANGALAAVGEVYFTPGGELFEVPEATYENLEPGNTIEYSYDAGLGKFIANKRVVKRMLSVNLDGLNSVSVEFE